MLWNTEIPKLCNLRRSSFTDNQEEYEYLVKQYKEVNVLYIDDLFKLDARLKEDGLSLAYDILNYRYMNEKITIISTETTKEQLRQLDVAICGRCYEMSDKRFWINLDGAEKNYRFPLDYGNQKPLAATTTVTGCGGVVISSNYKALSNKRKVVVKGITTGKIVDYGIKDSMNMGACMAPAAADVIYNNFNDLAVNEGYYDKIITGDLGNVGKDILLDILKGKGYDIEKVYMDCGIEIYYPEVQGTLSGGSGCGCSAVTLCGYILDMLRTGKWNRVLFIPTGALLSPVSFNEGDSVPGIAHGVILEMC
jgi:hypothetical protein